MSITFEELVDRLRQVAEDWHELTSEVQNVLVALEALHHRVHTLRAAARPMDPSCAYDVFNPAVPIPPPPPGGGPACLSPMGSTIPRSKHGMKAPAKRRKG
jgi:hypothetical protein